MIGTLGNALLGIMFLLLSLAGTFLMFRLWGYPFDHQKLKTSAPKGLVRLHHILGYAYGAIYLYLMIQMLPRLWSYEIEFPARTVAHLLLGLSIGILLVVKISIVRFFKYLESSLVPFLGIVLLVCTFLLVSLSVPFALKELYLHRSTVGGNAFSEENIERLTGHLPRAGFPSDVDLAELSMVRSLEEGRDVLLRKCVQCHDLRTVLMRPRTPQNWVQTVSRMASRAVFDPISEAEQWRVTAYLIAISPELQRSFSMKREQEVVADQSLSTIQSGLLGHLSSEGLGMDLDLCAETFEDLCTQCHGLRNLEKSPPIDKEEVFELVERMIENGLEASDDEYRQVIFYLTETYIHD
ncbi:MAG: hypothetical protein OEV30_04685 [Ignavibacteria bacterium]|nr:hypothetical protein [Ignavibacteria bacterium]